MTSSLVPSFLACSLGSRIDVDVAQGKPAKRKVPHPYSPAEENAGSLPGIRDDEAWDRQQIW
jgi:hypothetical protein